MIPNVTTVDKHGTHTYDIISEAFGNDRKIWLSREINDETATEIIAQLEYLDKQSNADITLYINSPGGSVSAGLAIIDAMERCRSDVSTVCTGTAASMGAMILVCGTKGKRRVTPYSEVMIHQPLGGFSGQASDMERAANHLAHTKKVLMTMLSERTGQPIRKVTSDCDRDSWLSAPEAIEYGIVDSILGKGEK